MEREIDTRITLDTEERAREKEAEREEIEEKV